MDLKVDAMTARAPGGNPPLSHYEADLRMPAGFTERAVPTESESVATIVSLRHEHRQRRYLTGVLLAFIAMAEDLLGQLGVDAVELVLRDHPALTRDASGRTLNTLTIQGPNSLISLRQYYNEIEKVIRHHLLRTGYPNSAPHATQSWSQYRSEFELICKMTPGERRLLADHLWEEVLALDEMAGQSGQERGVRPFESILMRFPNTQRGEPAGALLQGLAYAYYRADSPNVTLRVYKVGSGSSRVGAAGDVDGWVGDVLGLSVEVKDMDIDDDNLSQFDQFIMNLRRWPDCTSVVLARDFSDSARKYLLDHNIMCFDRERMASNVAFWDVPKQRLAVRELLYYLAVIEQSGPLLLRFKEFCTEVGIDLA